MFWYSNAGGDDAMEVVMVNMVFQGRRKMVKVREARRRAPMVEAATRRSAGILSQEFFFNSAISSCILAIFAFRFTSNFMKIL